MNTLKEQTNLLEYEKEETNMLEKIKASCQYVSANSNYVFIDYEKLDEYIKIIDLIKIKCWLSKK